MQFHSKKDTWISVLLWLTIGLLLASLLTLFTVDHFSVIIFILLAITSVGSSFFLAWCWFSTYYIFDDEILIAKSGPIKRLLKYADIKSVQKTNNPLAGLALSMKRIEIIHASYGTLIISPEDRDKFIKMLKRKNPKIVIKSK